VRDEAAGLHTAGHRGSPLGGLDQTIWRHSMFSDIRRTASSTGDSSPSMGRPSLIVSPALPPTLWTRLSRSPGSRTTYAAMGTSKRLM
jgi:hypothetical protein